MTRRAEKVVCLGGACDQDAPHVAPESPAAPVRAHLPATLLCGKA